MSLKGKALEVTKGIDREKLKEKDGPKVILGKLDEVFRKDTLMGSKEESEWWGSERYVNLGRGRGNYRSRPRGRGNRGRGGRNPMNKEGKVTQCVICKSE